jgi:glycosyltransferase involved in cell wall biosynthesis
VSLSEAGGSEEKDMENPLRLVYIIGTYPLLTMTYVDREIRALRQWGVELQILAVHRQDASIPLSADQRGVLQEGVVYLLPVNWLRFVISQLCFAILRPQRYFKTLIYLLTRPHPRGTARYLTPRFMTLLHFIEGVYAAYLLRGRQFEELHAHTADRAATIALVVGRLLDRPYSLSIHAGHDIFVNPILLAEKILEARHVATCTAYNKTYLESLIGQDLCHKISHIHHGLDLSKYQPNPFASNGRPKILSVGRLSEKKGLVHLVRACRMLKDRGYDFTCHIVGDGPQRAELRGLIEQLSLEDTVHLRGALPHEEVIENYRQATLFVLPCIKSRDGDMDGIPNVLPEAMAMQVPVVSTDISGIPELVDDQVNGLLAPLGDDDALAAAMVRLLDDPALRQRLGRNGRRSVAETFDVERNVRLFAAALWPDWFQA